MRSSRKPRLISVTLFLQQLVEKYAQLEKV